MLADTMVVLWWLETNPKLSRAANEAVGEPNSDILISVVSIFEIATKVKIGKLPIAPHLSGGIRTAILDQGFTLLPLDGDAAERAGSLPLHHKDPVDRLIIAQALARGLPVVTSDAIFEAYGVRRIW